MIEATLGARTEYSLRALATILPSSLPEGAAVPVSEQAFLEVDDLEWHFP
jgi:hypothetical protein